MLARTVAVSTAAVLMLGQSDRAQSAVYEQTDSGKVFELRHGARTAAGGLDRTSRMEWLGHLIT